MNPYTRLVALLPQRPLLVGTVTQVNAGVCTISMPGGGLATARGDAIVGQRVFFRDGAVEASAPTLPVEVISV